MKKLLVLAIIGFIAIGSTPTFATGSQVNTDRAERLAEKGVTPEEAKINKAEWEAQRGQN
ncbi:hypothetical protein AN643_03535 [Candidatus Epulonipiscioides saccharophilum]|nr:hypothetical protein AN643_03535 [Epulopiscium sp. SCG-B10WGA-EpuloB]